MNNTIFIHIAAYRDPELIPTINNALEKAKNPNRLSFGICLQETQIYYNNFPYLNDKRFRIFYVPFKQSKGCCWARNKADSLYRNENYILQLDSHHRFIQDWDIVLIDYLNKCPSKKSILSTYVNPYEPGGINDKISNDKIPCRMIADKFNNKLVLFRPTYVFESGLMNDRPQPTMFLSGHFVFTYGQWKKEIPYDPNIYFTGEEHSLAARSFTHGWDIYYPPRPIIFHMYTRKGRVKQWDDNKEWWKLDRTSRKRVINLLVNKINLGIYGLGKVRSMDEYQKLSGINYKTGTLSSYAKQGLPNYKAKLYITPKTKFHTHDYKLWIEHNGSTKFQFQVISHEPDKILLRDPQRNIDISLEPSQCKWKKSDQNKWNLLDYGTYIYNC